jgi:orotidine-5'-phosphate decarboxylase
VSPDDPRQHLALALDVDDLVVALRLARRLRPWFGVAKVGLELFSAAGPETISALTVEGYRVFLDLKLYDIPTTVRRAATVMGGLGVALATVHTRGGPDMVRAAVDGMTAGAAAAGAPTPRVLGVTVLTSDQDAPAPELIVRATLAAKAGCGGIVCAATDLEILREVVPDLLKVVPGIRPTGSPADDQARAATPSEAIAAGADLLVIGRAVTAADDPEIAAAKIFDEVAQTTVAQRG